MAAGEKKAGKRSTPAKAAAAAASTPAAAAPAAAAAAKPSPSDIIKKAAATPRVDTQKTVRGSGLGTTSFCVRRAARHLPRQTARPFRPIHMMNGACGMEVNSNKFITRKIAKPRKHLLKQNNRGAPLRLLPSSCELDPIVGTIVLIVPKSVVLFKRHNCSDDANA